MARGTATNDEQRPRVTNDRLRAAGIFLAAWILAWAVLTALALSQDGTLTDIGVLSALIGISAGMSAIGLLVFDEVPGRARLLALLILVLATAAVNARVASGASIGGGFVQELVNAATVLGIVLATRQGARSLMHQRLAQRAERARKTAEQRALNARMSPHVLYNMLNAIYAASLKEPARSSELILSLASMLRYLTESADRDFAPAAQELAFIADQAELIRARSGQADSIVLEFPRQSEIEVPSLLCATLFENAVTHGRKADGSLEIEAVFREVGSGFAFRVTNAFDPLVPSSHEGLGSGMAAIRDRLAFLYPGRYRFGAGAIKSGLYEAEIEVW